MPLVISASGGFSIFTALIINKDNKQIALLAILTGNTLFVITI